MKITEHFDSKELKINELEFEKNNKPDLYSTEDIRTGKVVYRHTYYNN